MIRIFRDTTSFPEPMWVCLYGTHLHIEPTFLRLLWSVLTEYKQDKHLVG